MTSTTLRILTLATLGMTPATHAAITAFDSTTDGTVNSVTVDGTSYTASSLINGTLTGYVDSNQVQFMVGEGGTVPAPGSRAALLSDLSLSTGALNASSITITFDAPVSNGAGIDLLVFDWGGFSGDTFSVTINGQTFNNLTNSDGSLPSGGDFYSIGTSATSDWFASDSTSGISSVAELEGLAFSGSKNDTTTTTRGVIGLDLGAFGVAGGGSVTEVTIFGGSNTVDPTLILAIPEPGIPLLGVLGGLVLLRRRRA